MNVCHYKIVCPTLGAIEVLFNDIGGCSEELLDDAIPNELREECGVSLSKIKVSADSKFEFPKDMFGIDIQVI